MRLASGHVMVRGMAGVLAYHDELLGRQQHPLESPTVPAGQGTDAVDLPLPQRRRVPGERLHRERHDDGAGTQSGDQAQTGAGVPFLDAVVGLEEQRDVGGDGTRVDEHVAVVHLAVRVPAGQERAVKLHIGQVEVVPEVARVADLTQPRQAERVDRAGEVGDRGDGAGGGEQVGVEAIQVGQPLGAGRVRAEHGAAECPELGRIGRQRIQVAQHLRRPRGEQVPGRDPVQLQPGAAFQVGLAGGVHALLPYHVGDRVRMDRPVLGSRPQPLDDRVDTHGALRFRSASVSRV